MLRAADVLQVRCLGTFAFRAAGTWSAGPPFKRGRELLQYLVSYPRVAASRETLAEAFWPSLDGECVTHRLHLAVSGARAALRAAFPDVEVIQCNGGSYTWHPAVHIESDFESLLSSYRSNEIRALESGVALYTGEYLAGENADWIYPLRARCANAYVTMLERLVELSSERGDRIGALEYAMRLLETDRAHEGATRTAMRLLAATGRRGAALSEYEALARYLRRHLAIEPSEQTTALRDEIIAG